jgi:hypothetical protein
MAIENGPFINDVYLVIYIKSGDFHSCVCIPGHPPLPVSSRYSSVPAKCLSQAPPRNRWTPGRTWPRSPRATGFHQGLSGPRSPEAKPHCGASVGTEASWWRHGLTHGRHSDSFDSNISLKENLQENPIFEARNPYLPADVPLNQLIWENIFRKSRFCFGCPSYLFLRCLGAGSYFLNGQVWDVHPYGN